jgi:ABC-type sugar transport system ATPase subunit
MSVLCSNTSPYITWLWFSYFIDVLFIFVLLQGKIIGVCGSVGSGKSSFISSILGRVWSFQKEKI